MLYLPNLTHHILTINSLIVLFKLLVLFWVDFLLSFLFVFFGFLFPHPVVGSMVLGTDSQKPVADIPKEHAQLPADFLNDMGELGELLFDEFAHHFVPVVVVLLGVDAHGCVAAHVLQRGALHNESGVRRQLMQVGHGLDLQIVVAVCRVQ